MIMTYKMGVWRVTYKFGGKTYAIERKFEHEAREQERDIQVYGCLTRVDFIDEEREPQEGPFEIEEA